MTYTIRDALHAFHEQGRDGDEANMHWFWLAWLLAGELWDDELWHSLATRGVRLAFDVVEGGVKQAARVSAGVRAGIRELFAGRTNGFRERIEDEDAIARFDAKA